MKIILITGDHPRHLYFADKFIEEILGMGTNLYGLLKKEEAFVPTPDKDLNID